VSCIVGAGCTVRGDYRSETYVVRAGDTLYSIAWRHNLDYRDLARWNDMGADYRISVGQILSLRPGPQVAHRPPAVPPSASIPATPRPTTAPPAASAAMPAASAAMPAGSAAAPGMSGAAQGMSGAAPGLSAAPRVSAEPPGLSAALPGGSSKPLGSLVPNARGWVWPTAHAGAPRPVQGGGILLLGELGQPVRAACAGRVAYVGNGIRGYGNLVIIKHGENLLTAYAHTRELGVREGQEVAAGQVIAQMGLGPHQIAALYFEVRLNGKPVDPMPFLLGSK
jgi:lipoprotein NlpD